jgi:N utilization substance protein A
VIREEDLAQAIGREGQNIRLASKMLDKEIDVFGDEEFANMSEEQRAAVQSETPVPSKSAENGAEEDIAPKAYSTETDQQDQTYDEAFESMREEARGERFEENNNEENPIMSDITASAIENLAQSDDDTKKAIDESHKIRRITPPVLLCDYCLQ